MPMMICDQGIYMYALSSIAANYMIYIDGEPLVVYG